MTPALDKIFIGYATRHGLDSDGDDARAFLIVSQCGSMEAWVDEAYLRLGQPLHWEVCSSNTAARSRQDAFQDARRVARSLGLVQLRAQFREAPQASLPTVRASASSFSPKGLGLILRMEN
jgi:hypothetical protein